MPADLNIKIYAAEAEVAFQTFEQLGPAISTRLFLQALIIFKIETPARRPSLATLATAFDSAGPASAFATTIGGPDVRFV